MNCWEPTRDDHTHVAEVVSNQARSGVIGFAVIYILLMISIAYPPMFIISIPLTYIALRARLRRARAIRSAHLLLSKAQRAEDLARMMRKWS